MSSDNKPTHYAVFVDKSTKEKRYFGKLWRSQYGYSLGLEKEFKRNDGTTTPGIKSMVITFTDNTTYDATGAFININEYKNNGDRATGSTFGGSPDPGGDDGIPW